MKKSNLPSHQSNFLLYTAADGEVKVDVFIKDETVWLTQKAMAELFGVKIPAISKHLANIYETGELQQEATLSILETVQKEGQWQVSWDRVIQDKNYISDFDKEIKRIEGKK
jgi:hypothetical protein